MKKVLCFVLAVLLMPQVCFALSAIGAKEAAMGGAGIALVKGLSSVTYNPAGIVRGPNTEFLLSAATASYGLDKLYSSMTSTNIEQFIQNNFNTALDTNGSLATLIGTSFNKFGVSILVPSATATITKTAGTYAGTSATLAGQYGLVCTIGQSLSLTSLNLASLDIGANVKLLNGYYQSFIASSAIAGTNVVASGNGLGYDLGAVATLSVPYVSSFSAGISLQNISQSFTYEPKSKTATMDALGNITLGAETVLPKQTDIVPPSTIIGCAGELPFGLAFALDLESLSGGSGYFATTATTITHIGVEYPMMANLLLVRAGTETSDAINRTSLGAKLNLPAITFNLAYVIDNKNSKNNQFAVDFGTGI
jgi:hypothetical protein